MQYFSQSRVEVNLSIKLLFFLKMRDLVAFTLPIAQKWDTVLLWNWISRELPYRLQQKLAQLIFIIKTNHLSKMNFHHRSAMLLLIKLFLYVLVIFFCLLWWISEPLISFESPLLQFCFWYYCWNSHFQFRGVNPDRKTNKMSQENQ